MCRRIAGNTRDADDACQEAMIKIVRNLPRFDGRSSFGTWAYRIATNASLDELRKRRRRPALHVIDDAASSDPTDTRAAQRVEVVGDRLLLDDALAELPDDLRVAVVLRDVADLDYGDIADTLDIPLGTVKSRIARGRLALAKRLRLDVDLEPTTGNESAERIEQHLTTEPDPERNQLPTDERPTPPT